MKKRYGSLPRKFLREIFPGIEKIDVHLLGPFHGLLGMGLFPIETLLISSIVKFTEPKNVLEIGTYNGNTALNIAANTPEDTVIQTVDLPPDWDGKLSYEVPEKYRNMFFSPKEVDMYDSSGHQPDRGNIKNKAAGMRFTDTIFSSKIEQIYGDSAKLDWENLKRPFDFIFIDGCHFYDYVKKDTSNAIANVKSGGIILWHDYGSIEDVTNVITEMSNKINAIAIRNTRFAIAIID